MVEGAADLFLRKDGSTLLFLPLAHVFGRMIEVGAVRAGLHLAHCSDPVGKLTADLQSFKPNFVLSVPRIFEKIYNGAEAKAEAAGKERFSVQPPQLRSNTARRWKKDTSPLLCESSMLCLII